MSTLSPLRLAMVFLAATVLAWGEPPTEHVGLQLWSLRNQFKVDIPGTLVTAQQFGFRVVETAGTYGLAPEQFRAALEAHGLKAVSAHLGYDMFVQDLPGVIRQAKALGVTYVVIPAMTHKTGFDAAAARAAAANFNKWGAALQAEGLKFAYHTHGYEFIPGPNGLTPFDVLVQSTNPELVCFEMDVFWVAHAGVDPVQLLDKYPDRWKLVHLKDLRIGANHDATGGAPATDDVPVGEGQIAWAHVLKTASADGVEYYFIEDESVAPLKNIPRSLHYLAPYRL